MDEQQAQIIAKRRAGATISELARQYGVSRLSIARIAKPEVARA
jgi:predicted transcriptional regulator